MQSRGYDEDDVSGSYGIVGSFPKGFGYGSEEPDHDVAGAGVETKPRILLMGLRRWVIGVKRFGSYRVLIRRIEKWP